MRTDGPADEFPDLAAPASDRLLRESEDRARAGVESPADLSQSLALVARAQKGDQGALDDLFRRYQEPVRRMARVRMGPRIRAFMDSQDLAQNTFLAAGRRIGDFRAETRGALVNWLARILQNQIHDANDYARAERRNRDREVPIDAAASGPGLDPAGPTPTPSSVAARHELVDIYDACVHELEDDQREVILLRDYAHGTWEYVTEQLGRPTPEATMQLYCRARTKLARLVEIRIGR